MKKFILIFSFSLLFSAFVPAQTVKVKTMPRTLSEFLELRNKIATTPQGGASMFVLALKIYAENPLIGMQCLVIAADRSRLQKGSVYKGFELLPTDANRIKRQIKAYPFLGNSYLKGASPQNGYQTKLPYILSFSSNPYSGKIESGKFKIFVKSSGANSPRPIKMYRNNKGFWKAQEWSTIIMGVQKPNVEIDDDL